MVRALVNPERRGDVTEALGQFSCLAVTLGPTLVFPRLDARAARLDLEIEDRFGNPVRPREWFLAPLHIIDEVVQRIRDETITGLIYDPATAALAPAQPQ